MDFDFRLIISFAFSIGILVEGIMALAKHGTRGDKVFGTCSIITGVLFLAASAIGVMRISTPSDTLLLAEWILYIVGFILFIIGLIIRKKSSAK